MNKYRQRCMMAQYDVERCKEYFKNVQDRLIYSNVVYMKRVATNGVPTLMEVDRPRLKSTPVKQSTLDGHVITMDCIPDYYAYRQRIKHHEDAIKEIIQEAKSLYQFRFDAMKDKHLGECYLERRAAYNEYLQSEAWREKRQECLNHHGHSCFDCGMHDSSLQCHHLHYNTLGDEDPAIDLIPLCKQCHEARHQ